MQIVKHKHVTEDPYREYGIATGKNENNAVHRILGNFSLNFPSFIVILMILYR